MKRLIPILLCVSFLLSGCSGWLDSNYQNVTPHEEDLDYVDTENVSVSNYGQLYEALCDLVETGTQSGIIVVAKYKQSNVEKDMAKAVKAVTTKDPVGAYAVDKIKYELGSSGGQPAVAVTISYIHGLSDLRKIQRVENMDGARNAIADSLDACNSGVVLYVANYSALDIEQWVSDYAAENPDKVMETPAVAVTVYPETGDSRVVELRFTYQNSRENLRLMQTKVSTLFEAAAIYAGEEGEEAERYYKLYSFLMGLFQNYQLDSSLTPTYSLLQHGVGDSKAFATVYAAMCEKVGLECIVVTGMKAGDPRYWNIVKAEDVYYHVDLLSCDLEDAFTMQTDSQMATGDEMNGYVWDYQAYPTCGEATED